MPGLLVADDEAIVRSTLVRTITASAPELGPISEAVSGEEAISLARQTRPNIVLMDVRMPGIDGLEATRVIRSENPRTRVIVLTAYDDFSFSQEALRLGAVDYLLKPVRPAILLNVLARTRAQIESEEQSQFEAQQVSTRWQDTLPLVEARLITDLVHGYGVSRSVLERALVNLEKTISAPAVMVVDVDHFGQATSGMEPERVELFCGLITDIVRRVVGDSQHCLIGHVRPGVVVAILSTGRRLAEIKDIRALGHAVRYAVESSAPVTVTVGIGHSYPDLDQASLSYSEAVRAQWYRPYFGINSVIHVEDVQSLNSARRPYPVDLERELVARVRLGEQQAGEALMERMLDFLLDRPDELPEILSTRSLELLALLSRAVIDAGAPSAEVLEIAHRQRVAMSQLKTGDDVRAWALRSLSALMQRIPAGDNSDRVVDGAVSYMRAHLSHPGLELKDVAQEVHVSPSHLAHLFKARIGTSYLKYLTRMRVEEAKRLLAATDMTVAAIAAMVGYEDPAYFHRVFRREVALTPNRYRQMVGAA